MKSPKLINPKSLVLPFTLLSMSAVACRTAEVASTPKMGAEFPRCEKPLSSITDTDDSEDLFPKTPFPSANAFDVALFEEVKRVLKSGTAEEKRGLDSFFEDSCLKLAAEKESSFAATFREQFNLDRSLLAMNLVESETKPVAAKRSGGNMYSVGGIVFVRGDIFPEGYYRGRYYAETRDGGGLESWATLDHMLHHAPWFELDREKKKYSFRTEGAARKLSEHLAAQSKESDIVLYHGGVEQDLKRPEADPRYLEKNILQPNMFFTTPKLNATREFALSMVFKLQIPRNEITQAIESDNAYIGTEFDYIELAFFNSPDGRRLIEKYSKPFCYSRDDRPIGGIPSCSQFWNEE